MLRRVAQSSRTPPHVPDHELVRRIGVGSYGEVWLARNIVGTWRAVKVVHRSRFDSDRPYQREFEGIRKFEPISRLYESQVDILHVGRNDTEGYFYYVMELADDAGAEPLKPGAESQSSSICDPHSYRPHTLKNEADDHIRLPVAKCVEIGFALTETLEHLHARGLVHRDVKPSNVVFVNGRPKLADIGLVTDADSTRTFVGTEGFLPPEGGGTPQADLYALGKVLYEMSTGKDRREFPRAPVDVDQLPDRKEFLELAEIIERACDPEPSRRYSSAREMHEDLKLIERGESVRRHNERRARVAVARKYGGMVTTVACVFVLGGLAATWWHLKRTPSGPTTLAPTPERSTASAAALNEYRLGRFWMAKRTSEGFSNALAHFDRAMELDPRFPHPHAARAECFDLAASYNMVPVAEAFPKARDAALAALRLNTNVVEAHLALALYQRSYEWDWAGAEASFRRALALNPGSASAHQWYSSLLSALGRVDEAVEHARRAVQLDPSSLSVNANLGARLYLARRYQEAIAQYEKVITMDPSFPAAYHELAAVYWKTDLLFDAARVRLEGLLRAGESRTNHLMLLNLMRTEGTLRFWRKYAEQLEDADPPKPMQLAAALIRAGLTNEALRALSDAVAMRDPGVIYLNAEPMHDAIRHEPDFARLSERLGLNASRGAEPLLEQLARRLTESDRGAGITIDEKGAGFRPLFDGRSLSGWRSDATNWTLVDGVIYRAASGGALRYEVETVPDNFELRFEWKVVAGSDSGVNYRPGMVEYQVIDGSLESAQHNSMRPASLVGCAGPGSSGTYPLGEWNEGRIICRGTTIEHWLNGRRRLWLDYNDTRMAAYMAQLETMEKRVLTTSYGNVRARGGYLLLQDQGTPVWFRRLRWRTLD